MKGLLTPNAKLCPLVIVMTNLFQLGIMLTYIHGYEKNTKDEYIYNLIDI